MDLLITPETAIPITGGISLLLLSRIVGGIYFPIFGLGACLFGIVAFSYNLIFNLGKIINRAEIILKNENDRKHQLEINDLYKTLSQDFDSRDDEALANLRVIYGSFKSDIENGKIGPVSESIIEPIHRIYDSIVHQLRRRYEISEIAKKVTGQTQKNLLQQCENLMVGIEQSLEVITKAIVEIRIMGVDFKQEELSNLCRTLELQLEATRATEQRLNEVMGDDYSYYENYQS